MHSFNMVFVWDQIGSEPIPNNRPPLVAELHNFFTFKKFRSKHIQLPNTKKVVCIRVLYQIQVIGWTLLCQSCLISSTCKILLTS